MFSGHDTDLMAIQTTLNPDDPFVKPGYASTYYFELWKKNNTSFIKIWYLDEIRNISKYIDIRNCGIECPLNDFVKVLDKYAIDLQTFALECSHVPNWNGSTTTEIP